MKGIQREVSPKSRRTAEVMARLFMFFLAALWILVYIATSLIMYDQVVDPATTAFFTPKSGEITTAANFLQNVCSAWFFITFILFGIWISIKSFRLVGKWEPKGKGNSSEVPDAKGK